ASTNSHSVFSLNKKLSDEELQITQEEVDNIYQLFLKRVADGRGMKVEEVHKIARGRVWTGEDALENGLVDEIGGMNEAITYTKKKIGSKRGELIYYPKVKENKLESFIEMIEEEEEGASLKSNSILNHPYLKEIGITVQKIEALKGIQMRLPYDVKIN
ncbi:S49 family peptidase, partial [Crocinitomicaceae bacterium]|nr:S49 family peptidase [Crocinitomicaceae bacterium]